MDSDAWWYIVGERKAGPVDWAALQERAREGLLRQADPVWREGLPDWVPAGSLEGLFGAATTAATAPPPFQGQPPAYGPRPSSGRTRLAAILFALLLGGFGAHKFYLGETGLGVVYLLFCWTCIPALIALIEGIVYLTMTDEAFAAKYA